MNTQNAPFVWDQDTTFSRSPSSAAVTDYAAYPTSCSIERGYNFTMDAPNHTLLLQPNISNDTQWAASDPFNRKPATITLTNGTLRFDGEYAPRNDYGPTLRIGWLNVALHNQAAFEIDSGLADLHLGLMDTGVDDGKGNGPLHAATFDLYDSSTCFITVSTIGTGSANINLHQNSKMTVVSPDVSIGWSNNALVYKSVVDLADNSALAIQCSQGAEFGASQITCKSNSSFLITSSKTKPGDKDATVSFAHSNIEIQDAATVEIVADDFTFATESNKPVFTIGPGTGTLTLAKEGAPDGLTSGPVPAGLFNFIPTVFNQSKLVIRNITDAEKLLHASCLAVDGDPVPPIRIDSVFNVHVENGTLSVSLKQKR